MTSPDVRSSRGSAEAPGPTAERATAVRWRVLGLLTLAAAISYLARSAVSVAESTIREDLQLSLRGSGWFMGSFFWSYAILQVPSGWIAFRRGSRLALAVFGVGWSAAAVGIGLAPALWLLIAAQLLMGAAQAGVFPASCHSIAHWIPLSRRSLACGLLATGMQVGAIVAGLITGPLLAAVNWRAVFLLFSVPGFVWAAVFLRQFRDDPSEDARVNDAERTLIGGSPPLPHAERSRTPWRAIACSSPVWFLCGQQICRASGYMFFASWFPSFLQQTRGVTVEQSGYLQALVFTGTMVGSLSGGWLTDWIWQRTGSLRLSRSGVGTVFLTGCAALILSAWFVEAAVTAVALLSVGAVFAALAGPCAFAATIDIGGDHVPQVFGLMNMTGNLAAAATPILVAELFAWTRDWNLVLIVFAAIYLAGALCWSGVNSAHRIAG